MCVSRMLELEEGRVEERKGRESVVESSDCYNKHEIRGREQCAKSVEVGCQFKGYAWGEGKREGGMGCIWIG